MGNINLVNHVFFEVEVLRHLDDDRDGRCECIVVEVVKFLSEIERLKIDILWGNGVIGDVTIE
jgi:hypothetical protein